MTKEPTESNDPNEGEWTSPEPTPYPPVTDDPDQDPNRQDPNPDIDPDQEPVKPS